MSSGTPSVGRRGLGVQPARDAARLARGVAGLDRQAHRPRHPGGVLGARDRAGQQHAVAARLHRERGVRGGADAGVEDHRHAGLLDDQAQVVRVVDPHAAADRRAERHHRRAAGVLEPARQDRVVVGVGEHDEAVGHQLLGGRQQLGGVGQQRLVVADHLELHPVGLERLAGEPGGGDRVARREAAGGVRQQEDAQPLEHLDDRAARERVHAPQRHRGHLGAGGLDRLAPSPRGCGSRRCR